MGSTADVFYQCVVALSTQHYPLVCSWGFQLLWKYGLDDSYISYNFETMMATADSYTV